MASTAVKMLTVLRPKGDPYTTFIAQLTNAGVSVIWDANAKVYTDTGLTTPATNGQDVAGWGDQGSGGLNLTEATNKPVLATSDINALPAVQYTSTNTDKLKRTVAGVVAGLSAYNIFAVYKSTSTALQTIYAEGNTSDGLPFCALRMNLAAVGRISWQHRQNGGAVIAQINTAPTPAANDGNVKVITVRRIASNAFSLRVNGASIGTSADAPGATTVNEIGVGTFPQSSDTNYFTGSIAFVGIATTDVYATVEPLLAARYGIALP